VIDFGVICGNLSAAVGAFGIDEGLIRARELFAKVRIFCTNIGRDLTAEVRVRDGKSVYEGKFGIDGVPPVQVQRFLWIIPTQVALLHDHFYRREMRSTLWKLRG
jgi:2-methylaconitate cis-trans-isomerase PrpF